MFRIRTALAGVAVAVAAALAVAAPAAAHDQLVSSTPAADEHLAAAPEEVVLTFSNDLLSMEDNSGTAMTVIDDAGKDWVAGAPVVEADTVTVPLEPDMPGGAYTVTWKVVSSDGHPTSGEYSFSVAAAQAEPAPAETTAPAESAQPSSPAQTDDPATAPAETDTAPWPLLIGLGVLALAAIVIVVVAVRRKR